MQEKTLLKISIISSIIGLIILYLISSFTTIENFEIKDLTLNDLDKTIKVQGLITRITPTDSITILEVAQHNKMPVIIFDTNISTNIGDEISVLGKVEEYNGKIELIADKIEKI